MAMENRELQSTIRRHVDNAIGGYDTDVADTRGRALDFYQMKPFGNEVEEESKFVSSDVHDVIQTIMPDVVGPFVTSDDAVTYQPVGPEDEESAKQATAYVNYKLRDIQFLLLHDWFKSAFIEINSVVKAWYDDIPRIKVEDYQGLSENEYLELVTPDNVEVLEHTQETDDELTEMAQLAGAWVAGMKPLLKHSVKIEKSTTIGLTAMAIPSEEFLIDRRARNFDDPDEVSFTCHQSVKTESELLTMGYDKDQVEAFPSYDELSSSEERIRRDDNRVWAQQDVGQGPTRTIAYYEAYLKIDFDDDGISELRQVCCAGPAFEVLRYKDKSRGTKGEANEEVERHPFFVITPDRLPHRFFGISWAELLFDIQLIKSQITRQWLSNISQVNNARTVGNDKVDLDSALDKRIGGHVIIEGDGDVRASFANLDTTSVAQHVAPMLDHLDKVGETRTGTFKYENALASNTLHDTKGGLDILVGAMHKRTQMVARIFAEMGVKPLYKYLLQLATKNQDKEEYIKLRGKFVPMTPSKWNPDMDVQVNIGLGHGTKEQQIMATRMILEDQEKIMMTMGADNPLVGIPELRNALAKKTEAIGFPMVGQFFKDPSDEELAAYQKRKSQPQPNPLAEAEMVKAQAAAAKDQSNMRIEIAKDAREREQMGADNQFREKELSITHELKLRDLVLKDERDRLKGDADFRSKDNAQIRKAEDDLAKLQQANAEMNVDAALKSRDLDIKEADLNLKADVAGLDADIKREEIAAHVETHALSQHEDKGGSKGQALHIDARSGSFTEDDVSATAMKDAANRANSKADIDKLMATTQAGMDKLASAMTAEKEVVTDKDGNVTGMKIKDS